MNDIKDKKVHEYFTDTLEGFAHWAKLTKPTTETNKRYKSKYIIHIRLTDEEGNPVIDANGVNQLDKAEKLGLTIFDKNDEQGKFVKIKRDALDRDGNLRKPVPAARKDEEGNDIPVKIIPNNSRVKVMSSFWRYDEDEFKATSYLMGVLVLELAEMDGGEGFSDEFGFMYGASEKKGTQANVAMDAQDTRTPVPSEPAFDDEIPF